jgi:hypothetical protein
MLNSQEFFTKYPNLTGSAQSYAKALIASGADEEKIIKFLENFSEVKASKVIISACPNCKGNLQRVKIIGDKEVMYCPKDRTTIPCPVE